MSKEDQDKVSMDMLARDNTRRFEDDNADLVNRQECDRLCAELVQIEDQKRTSDHETNWDNENLSVANDHPGDACEESRELETT